MATLTCVCPKTECGNIFHLQVDTPVAEGFVINVPNQHPIGPLCPICNTTTVLAAGQFKIRPEDNGDAVPAIHIAAPIPQLGLDIIAVEQAIPSQKEIRKNLICSKCGFESPGITISFNQNTRSFIGPASIAGACEKCGHNNELDLGSMTIDERGLTQIFLSPEFTPTVLRQLRSLVQETQAQPEKAVDFVKKADAIVPSFSKQFKKYLKDPANLVAFIGVVSGILFGLVALLKPETPTTVNNYYNYPAPAKTAQPASQAQPRQLAAQPAKRGSNLTPPKKKRPAKHKRHPKK